MEIKLFVVQFLVWNHTCDFKSNLCCRLTQRIIPIKFALLSIQLPIFIIHFFSFIDILSTRVPIAIRASSCTPPTIFAPELGLSIWSSACIIRGAICSASCGFTFLNTLCKGNNHIEELLKRIRIWWGCLVGQILPGSFPMCSSSYLVFM